MEMLVWFGILLCITQSALFSGLNLAFFSISRLGLQVETQKNNRDAVKVARLREDSNYLLTTILWGNVGINVLLTMLSNSVMAGVGAFIFSTFAITFLGEIIPQAYFSRHALKVAALFSPLVRVYQILLFPVAKPTAVILDKWLGPEAVRFINEGDVREYLKLHMDTRDTDIDRVEGLGALNFLEIDDLPVIEQGQVLDPGSVVPLEFAKDTPLFPRINCSAVDPFLQRIQASQKKWVVITDRIGRPRIALDADSFLRAALFGSQPLNPLAYCHRPVLVEDGHTALGEIIPKLRVATGQRNGQVIDQDIILFWGSHKRIITGADILGRLLQGIVQQRKIGFEPDQSLTEQRR